MTKKKPQTNPIEEAIGDRAKSTKDVPKIVDKEEFKKLVETLDEPSPQEMSNLEELNRQTEERLLNDSPVEVQVTHTVPKVPIIPVPKPDHLTQIKNSSLESPPQKNENPDVGVAKFDVNKEHVEAYNKTAKKLGIPLLDNSVEIEAPPQKIKIEGGNRLVVENCSISFPAEDKELVALRDFIMDSGFVASGVAMHIVALCSQPMTIPSTITWDFADRAMIPDMVFALLKQPGYLEGIWPSLKVMMGSNKGNASWTAGIATTLALFDTVRMLPVLAELKNENGSR